MRDEQRRKLRGLIGESMGTVHDEMVANGCNSADVAGEIVEALLSLSIFMLIKTNTMSKAEFLMLAETAYDDEKIAAGQ